MQFKKLVVGAAFAALGLGFANVAMAYDMDQCMASAKADGGDQYNEDLAKEYCTCIVQKVADDPGLGDALSNAKAEGDLTKDQLAAVNECRPDM